MTMTDALHKKFIAALTEWLHIPESKRPTQWHFWHYGHWYTIRIIDGAANVWRVSENSNTDQWIGSEEVTIID